MKFNYARRLKAWSTKAMIGDEFTRGRGQARETLKKLVFDDGTKG